MSSFLNCLRQPEYVHVVLNHVPLVGLFGALLPLVCALALRSPAPQFLGLGLVLLFSLSAWPVSEYGEAAYDRVLSMSDDAGAAYLARHRELAQRWLFLFYVTGGAAGAAIIVGIRWPRLLCPAGVLVAVLAAASLVAGAVIADCGGKIRHREFRFGPRPMAPALSWRGSGGTGRSVRSVEA